MIMHGIPGCLTLQRPRRVTAAGNGLLSALSAYWSGNEAAGNALDLHTNALHLSDFATVTSNPGIVYPLSRQYTAATNEYHGRAASDLPLESGNVDLTIAIWINLDSAGVTRALCSKYTGATTSDYTLYYNAATARFNFAVRNAANTAFYIAVANTFGAPGLGTWYFVVAWLDISASTVNIQVNDGAADSAIGGTGIASTALFRIGRYASNYADGRIGPTAVWRSVPGGGAVLTAAQRTALYNAGAGLDYASFTL